MVLDPFRAAGEDINSVWQHMEWEQPTGFFQVYRLPGEWFPYEQIAIKADDFHIFFDVDEVKSVGFSDVLGAADFDISPPAVVIFARGEGDSPAEIISTGRDAAESLAGLLNVLLGNGYPVLAKAHEAVFRKDNTKTIKYYPARSRVGWKNVTKSEIMEVLKPISPSVLNTLPDNVKLALRWYGKGIREEHPVDKFISLYECTLAVVSRWHFAAHKEAYDVNDPPPRRVFRDWIRDARNAADSAEEDVLFEPFNRIVDKRNRIFKANDLNAEPEAILDVVGCSTQVLKWVLSQFLANYSFGFEEKTE
ncbi:MAG: hypothetical protein BZY75_01230 [SAR202 cluster bacterium Io17-Chloro-G7]|nr:MAG: hypothetical protein BZY75_01230 [SAR202 cluster bacterium Io17-Chloro-G7]